MPDNSTTDFAYALQARADAVLDACTACGKCFDICPMTTPAGIASKPATTVTASIRDLLAGSAASPEAARWATVCSGSGHCIDTCPEGVNPRFMLTLARLALSRQTDAGVRRAAGARGYRGMAKAVRVLSRIQLPADVLARFEPEADTRKDDAVDCVFYTGCNLRRTPHIALLCFDMLERLGTSWRVEGGPQACCGVIQTRAGDLDAAGSLAYRTLDRFAVGRPKHVLAWCPTCQIQLSETVLPGRQQHEPGRLTYDMQPFLVFLADNLERLRPWMTRPVRKRVALHEHPGAAGVTEAALRLLDAVPGLEIVDLHQPSVGYMCNTLQPLAEYKRDLHRDLLEAAAAARIDVLAGIYHVCHRELCSHERDWPFDVVNVMELIGESMGLAHTDLFKRLKIMQDTDAVLADVADLAQSHGLSLDDVRDVISRELLGEQPLPLNPHR